MTSPMDDEINAALRKRGVANYMQGIGRKGLIDNWRGFIEDVEAGYKNTIYEYQNDLDGRRIIEAVGLGKDPDVVVLDDRLKALLIDTSYQIWHADSKDAFWIYGYPKNAGEELAEDIKRDKETNG